MVSIVALVKEALRSELPPLARPLSVDTAKTQQSETPSKVPEVPDQDRIDATLDNDRVTNALSALVKYIPGDVVALYLATITVIPALGEQEDSFWLSLSIYLGFTILLTPLIFTLVYLRSRRQLRLKLFLGWWKWPWWQMIAAVIAFAVWGLAIPNDIIRGKVPGAALGVVAMLISLLLSLLGGIFEPTRDSPRTPA